MNKFSKFTKTNMAYRRRRLRRPRKGRRKLHVSKSVKQYVKKQIHRNEEDKFLNATQTTATLDNTNPAQTFFLTGTGQGAGETQRVGDQAKLKSLRMKLLLDANGSTVGQFMVRLLLVRQPINDGSDIDTTKILDYTSNSTIMTSPAPDFSFRNEYHVMYDKTFLMSGQPTTATSADGNSGVFPKIRKISINKYFKNGLLLNYVGATTARADQNKNRIFLVAITGTSVDMSLFINPQIVFEG